MMTESTEARLAILDRMVERLDEYLDDDQLYKTISVYPPDGERLVKLTIGAMLEHFDALHDRDGLTTAQRERLVELERAVGRVKKQRDEAYYSKLAQELKSYADSWRWFLQTCEDGDHQCETEYPHEVKTRLRIERLLEEAGDRPQVADERRRVEQLDRRLRDVWSPGEFVLRDEPADAYPRDQYWWLYGRPRIEDV